MITTTVHDDIAAFAAAVRSHLDDLPTDEVDDLLDGLEADLSDQAAEAADDFTLPDAATYAAELRAAAGLPERGTPARRTRASIVQQVRAGWRETGAAVQSNPVGGWILDLLSSLRPVWWILRGVCWYLLAFLAVWMVVPSIGYGGLVTAVLVLNGSAVAWGFLLSAVLLSIQWGRGRWLPAKWLPGLRTVASIAVVVTLPLLIGVFSNAVASYFVRDTTAYETYTPGLSVDGQRVRNIFAFDADGNAIPLVQLFDQDGNPLTTVGRDPGSVPFDTYFYGGGGPVPVAYVAPGARDTWNTYPLREIPAGVSTWDWSDDITKAATARFPFPRVQPLPSEVVGGLTDPVPDATPTPIATVAP
ncbi:hypothetical protein [uncultured Microbacterium sp.]|uniref:hypothetical protein n=1 Tax=uncultured Microbacterium sp. TaxID=191216 RepID=UPI0025CEC175|nr:hypothetical protein [uncultured Microbacterium sp.]